ncbi:MAG: DUF732 domain-containing protein [Mycobacterium sp.]
MTSLATHRLWTSPTLRNAMVIRQRLGWVRHVVAIGLAFRPLVVTLAIAAAAAMWPAHAHADVLGDTTTNGIGANGPLSTTLAGIGQSICPMLVKPGGTLASMATQMSGHDGLAPTIAGFVASTAIQAECPSWMTSLANGQMPAGLEALTSMAGPALQLPGTAPASPLPFGGAGPATPSPLSLLGSSPVAPSPIALPGTGQAPAGLQIPDL